ncbi:MAG TPA: HIT family protein, partial [Candidatus Omnitrophota bacterium]|nr:HIT family protein [Candidatus Omnitrophota bacterium]
MASIFTRIINGEIPCHKICEDQDYLAILEIKPINPGHTIVVLKKEIDYFFNVDDRTLGG